MAIFWEFRQFYPFLTKSGIFGGLLPFGCFGQFLGRITSGTRNWLTHVLWCLMVKSVSNCRCKFWPFFKKILYQLLVSRMVLDGSGCKVGHFGCLSIFMPFLKMKPTHPQVKIRQKPNIWLALRNWICQLLQWTRITSTVI